MIGESTPALLSEAQESAGSLAWPTYLLNQQASFHSSQYNLSKHYYGGCPFSRSMPASPYSEPSLILQDNFPLCLLHLLISLFLLPNPELEGEKVVHLFSRTQYFKSSTVSWLSLRKSCGTS